MPGANATIITRIWAKLLVKTQEYTLVGMTQYGDRGSGFGDSDFTDSECGLGTGIPYRPDSTDEADTLRD